METTRSESLTPAAHPPVIEAYNRLKAGEPARIQGINFDHLANIDAGTIQPRTDDELLVAAERDVSEAEAYAASPEGRYVAAMTATATLAAQMARVAQQALSGASRGFAGNRGFCAGLALDLGNDAARMIRAAAIAQVACEPKFDRVDQPWDA